MLQSNSNGIKLSYFPLAVFKLYQNRHISQKDWFEKQSQRVIGHFKTMFWSLEQVQEHQQEKHNQFIITTSKT